jgi:CRP-like cAMP-binding protein
MAAQNPYTAALTAKLEARDDLSADERDVLDTMVGEFRTVAAGEDIVRDGDRPTHSTLLIEGFASRYKVLQGGERQLTAIHVPGDFVDLHSFLLKEMDHAVGAMSVCRVVTVPHATLERLSHTHPHLTRLFWLLTLIDGASHREWLVAMGRRPAVGQLSHLICELFLRLQVIGAVNERSFTLPITQIELGDVLGLSSVHVNRTLQELRGLELITWRGQTVTILDWPGLQQMAEFDPRYLHLVKEHR